MTRIWPITQHVAFAKVAPQTEWEPGIGFITTVNGERFLLGRDPDSARRNYVALVQPEAEAA